MGRLAVGAQPADAPFGLGRGLDGLGVTGGLSPQALDLAGTVRAGQGVDLAGSLQQRRPQAVEVIGHVQAGPEGLGGRKLAASSP
jgi:hypothetical protein